MGSAMLGPATSRRETEHEVVLAYSHQEQITPQDQDQASAARARLALVRQQGRATHSRAEARPLVDQRKRL